MSCPRPCRLGTDAALTRRVKAAGLTWTVQEKKGRMTFSRGVWAPADRIAAIRAELDAERSTDAYTKRRTAEVARRDRKQTGYEGTMTCRSGVDADACPGEIKELLFHGAKRTETKVTLVAVSPCARHVPSSSTVCSSGEV